MVVTPDVRECFRRNNSILIASSSFNENILVKRLFTLGINSSEAVGFCWQRKGRYFTIVTAEHERLMFDLNLPSLQIPTLNFAQNPLHPGAGPVKPRQKQEPVSPLPRSAHAPQPLYLPGGARRGRLLLRGNWCRARRNDTRSGHHLIRFCVRVSLQVYRSSQIVNSASISTSWHRFRALTFAAN